MNCRAVGHLIILGSQRIYSLSKKKKKNQNKQKDPRGEAYRTLHDSFLPPPFRVIRALLLMEKPKRGFQAVQASRRGFRAIWGSKPMLLCSSWEKHEKRSPWTKLLFSILSVTMSILFSILKTKHRVSSFLFFFFFDQDGCIDTWPNQIGGWKWVSRSCIHLTCCDFTELDKNYQSNPHPT